jgi:hypothetical protein
MIQSVDIEGRLLSKENDAELLGSINVVDAVIKRVFGAAGSTAEVQVIFDDVLGLEQEKQLRRMIDQGVVDSARRPHRPDSIYNMHDTFKGLGPQVRRDNELKLVLDVSVTNITQQGTETVERRLFTGTVIEVKQNSDRIVTFTALDRRHDLNRYMVKLDTTGEPQPSTDIIDSVLGPRDALGRGLELTKGEDYFVDLGDGDPELIKDSWGIDGHATVWEVLKDISRVEGATMYIDGYNRFYMVDWPDHIVWGPNTMAPVIGWESGDEQSSTDVPVESPYDETGLGMYAPISGERQESRIDNPDNLGREISENNVFTRRALENIRSWESISSALMKDSGKVNFLGDPRILPYDEMILDNEVIDGFAPIAPGQYTAKRVYHRINAQDGYITEVHLGRDTEELFNTFAEKSIVTNSQNAPNTVSNSGGWFDIEPILPDATVIPEGYRGGT